jgi:hypothetical protein
LDSETRVAILRGIHHIRPATILEVALPRGGRDGVFVQVHFNDELPEPDAWFLLHTRLQLSNHSIEDSLRALFQVNNLSEIKGQSARVQCFGFDYATAIIHETKDKWLLLNGDWLNTVCTGHITSVIEDNGGAQLFVNLRLHDQTTGNSCTFILRNPDTDANTASLRQALMAAVGADDAANLENKQVRIQSFHHRGLGMVSAIGHACEQNWLLIGDYHEQNSGTAAADNLVGVAPVTA